jgi:hypothetical protein
MKISKSRNSRVRLGLISRSTRGGNRGVIEPFGLYTPASTLD